MTENSSETNQLLQGAARGDKVGSGSWQKYPCEACRPPALLIEAAQARLRPCQPFAQLGRHRGWRDGGSPGDLIIIVSSQQVAKRLSFSFRLIAASAPRPEPRVCGPPGPSAAAAGRSPQRSSARRSAKRSRCVRVRVTVSKPAAAFRPVPGAPFARSALIPHPLPLLAIPSTKRLPDRFRAEFAACRSRNSAGRRRPGYAAESAAARPAIPLTSRLGTSRSRAALPGRYPARDPTPRAWPAGPA